jgi:hypothetical protein
MLNRDLVGIDNMISRGSMDVGSTVEKKGSE